MLQHTAEGFPLAKWGRGRLAGNHQVFVMRHGRILFAALGLLLFMPGTLRAQDSLEGIIKSKDISRTQEATMEAEVALRFRRLADAKSADSRESARERITRTATIAGATPAGLAAYAKTCAAEAWNLVSNDDLDKATDGIMVLSVLDHPNTSEALAEGLRSKHAVVRLMAARAIEKLQNKLKDEPSKVRSALSALGRAGASEQEAIVLRVIYQAIDFKADVPSFKNAGDSADALAAVLDARMSQLESGSRGEMTDDYAIDAAVRCYGDAAKNVQAKLISCMYRYLAVCVDRFFDPETASEYLPTLDRLINRIEDAIRNMAKASGSALSCNDLKLNPRQAGNAKHQEDATKILDCISNALAGDPWNVR